MSNTLGGILADSAVPPWLPRDAQEARRFSYWAQIMFLLMAFIWFVLGIVWITLGVAGGKGGTAAFGFFGIIIAAVCGLSGIFLKRSLIDDIDHGRFHEARTSSVFWILVGLLGFALPTILLLLTYMKLSDVLAPHAPQYSPYSPGQVAAQQYQPYQPPPQQPAPPPAAPMPPPVQPHAREQKYQMAKCGNCGVQFPAFMANCPNCGAPKHE